MKKLLTKLMGITLGLAMVVGAGAAIANNKEVTEVNAATSMSQITLANSTFSRVSGGTYTDYCGGKGVKSKGSITIKNDNISDLNTLYANNNITKFDTFNVTVNNLVNGTVGNGYVQVSLLNSSGTAIDSKNYTPSGKGSNTSSMREDAVSFSNISTQIKGIQLYFNNASQASGWAIGDVKLNGAYSTAPTLSSISLSGSYPTEFTVGDTFSHEGIVVTATYSDESTTDVTADAVFSGYDMSSSGEQTVTVTYTEGNTSKTATYDITVAPLTTPYITPTKFATSGYTGQNETLSFTFGNLESTLNVTSDDTDVVTVNEPSITGQNGTVQINFVGVGTEVPVYFKDGESSVLATVLVTVTASSVSITGLPETASVTITKTIDLGALTEVSTYGIYSNNVTWISENTAIAEVTSAGIVEGKKLGTTNIVVTSDDYPTATMTCKVTVNELPASTTFDFSKISDLSSWGSSYSDHTIEYTGFGNVIFAAASKQTGTITDVPVTKGSDVEFVASSGVILNSVFFDCKQWSSKNQTITLHYSTNGGTDYVSTEITSDTFEISDNNLPANTNAVKFTFSSTSNQIGIEALTIGYVIVAKTNVENNVTTRSSLSYKYDKDAEGNFTFSDVAIRFGGFISKTMWDEVNSKMTITGFGVLLSNKEFLNGAALKGYFDEIDNVNVKKFDHDIVDLQPAEANDAQKIEQNVNLEDVYYVWNLYKKVAVATSLTKEFTSVAYIKTSRGNVFLKEVTTSVKKLASDLLNKSDSDEYDDTYLEGSLAYLANL